MEPMNCALIGAPVQSGASQPGCLMGPDAFRTAGLEASLTDLGHTVSDLGNVVPETIAPVSHPNDAIQNLEETIGFQASTVSTRPCRQVCLRIICA